jgi:hypothetical protein
VKKKSRYCLRLVYVYLLLGCSALAQSAGADPGLSITVLVDNYAQVSPAVLAGAEREAGRILGEAGLQAVWLECPMGPPTAGPQGPCQKPPEATDLRLRILPAPIRNKFPDSVFGFTVHPVLASVYYEYALRLAKSDDAEFAVHVILGCVIVHELGHLLLGPNSHSVVGIMQPLWERKQVEQALTGTLLFMPEQSKVMRAQARMRMKLQTGDPQSGGHGTIGQQAPGSLVR